MTTVPWSVSADAVLTIQPASDEVRKRHPGASQVLVEHYQGQSFIVSTDLDCPFGIDHAAPAWAEATGAAYLSRVPS